MLNWYPYGEHAGFYYGLEKGIFRDAGIDLTIQPGGGSTQTVQAVAAGKVDFGYADTPALLRTIAAGADVKSIGVFLQTTPAAVQFFADKNMQVDRRPQRARASRAARAMPRTRRWPRCSTRTTCRTTRSSGSTSIPPGS